MRLTVTLQGKSNQNKMETLNFRSSKFLSMTIGFQFLPYSKYIAYILQR